MTEILSRRPALIQWIGLCPLLPLSHDWRSGAVLGVATFLVAVSSGVAVSLLRNQLADWSRGAALTLLIAIAVGAVEIGARAFAYDSWNGVALFLPLLLSNGLLWRNADACAHDSAPGAALHRASLNGAIMAVLLFGVGAARTGLSADALGATALITAGLIIAAKNYLGRNGGALPDSDTTPSNSGPRRVRVTGPVR